MKVYIKMNKKNINFPWKADLNKKSGKVQIKKIIETFKTMFKNL